MTIGAAPDGRSDVSARWRISRLRLPAPGLYPAFTLGIACLAYGIPTLHPRQRLSVGLHRGGHARQRRAAVRRPAFDACTTHSAGSARSSCSCCSACSYFRRASYRWSALGLGVALVLVFIARPLVVAICLAPFRYPLQEIVYVGWVGLRGAVPIVLATIPVMSGAPGSRVLFDIVFFIVRRRLAPAGRDRAVGDAQAAASIEAAAAPPTIVAMEGPKGKRSVAVVLHRSGARGCRCGGRMTLPLPAGAAVTMIDHAGTMFAASDSSVLRAGDHVYVLYSREDSGGNRVTVRSANGVKLVLRSLIPPA